MGLNRDVTLPRLRNGTCNKSQKKNAISEDRGALFSQVHRAAANLGNLLPQDNPQSRGDFLPIRKDFDEAKSCHRPMQQTSVTTSSELEEYALMRRNLRLKRF